MPRTRASHTKHIQSLTGSARDHMSTAYGVKEDSILNSSNYFHVVDGLCPDIMHDVLEGILAYEMKLLLQFCIRSGYFSLQLLNSRMKAFTYGPADARDKPAQISATTLCSSDNKLKQSGKLHF